MQAGRSRWRSFSATGMFALVFLAGCGGTAHHVPTDELTQTQQSTHFTFHYSPGDNVDPARTEAFYTWITDQLSIDTSRRIEYYKYVDVAQKRRLSGKIGNAFADASTFSVHTIFGWDNHETTHLITSTVGIQVGLFDEGIAVAFETDPYNHWVTPNWNGQPPHAWAKQFLQQGKLPNLTAILDNEQFRAADSNITYPTSGSFVEYLVDQYGIAKVLQLFPGASYLDAPALNQARFQKTFGISLAQAEQAWRIFLLQYEVNPPESGLQSGRENSGQS